MTKKVRGRWRKVEGVETSLWSLRYVSYRRLERSSGCYYMVSCLNVKMSVPRTKALANRLKSDLRITPRMIGSTGFL